MQKTKATKNKDIIRSWHLYDVSEKILGRAATEIALLLKGKAKPYYVSHLDCGDYVVVINAQKIKVTGNKAKEKLYARFSGYPGGLKKIKYSDTLANYPDRIVRHAVSGMLADNKLKDRLLRRLYVYPKEEHPYKDKFK